MKLTVGCDPEVFVAQSGTFKSAHNLIPGDKKNPFPVRHGAVQVDGMALEFNIDPASTEDQFAMYVQDVFNQLKLMVPDYEIVTVPVAHFTPEYMAQQPKEALELGCDPDFNAWRNGEVNIKPQALRPMRTASGHVHLGWTNGQNIQDPSHIAACNAVAQQMDFYLGLPSLAYDNDQERRSLYGKAGCVRYKTYGVEYRTLSNAWLKSEKLMRWVFKNAQEGFAKLVNGNALVDKYGDIQSIINEGRVKDALKICDKEGITVCGGAV